MPSSTTYPITNNGGARFRFKSAAEIFLAAVFVAAWAALIWLTARTVMDIAPAMSVGDAASLAVGLILWPWLIYLAQGLFYLPRPPAGRAMFIRERLFNAPLIFLPFPAGGRIETGPALTAVTTDEERAALLAEAQARLKSFTVMGCLSLLLEARSPIDLILTRLSGRSPLAAWPSRFIYMIMGPARQLMRLSGYLFFCLWRAWDDPGPEDEFTAYKKGVARDLEARLTELDLASGPDEILARRELLAALRRVYADRTYGGSLDIEESGAAGALYGKPYLSPKFRGLYLDQPVTLAAVTIDKMYDHGGEDDASVFYTPELNEEVERAALLENRCDFLETIAAQYPEEGLVRLEGRLIPTWKIRAELLDRRAELDLIQRRLAAHHRRCRSSHLAKAAKLGRGWPETLRALAGLIHLAEHGRRNLTLALEAFHNSPKNPAAPPDFKNDDAEHDQDLSPVEALQITICDLSERLERLPAELEVRGRILTPGAKSAAFESDSHNGLDDWKALVDNILTTLDALRDKALSALVTAEDILDRGENLAEPPLTVEAPEPYFGLTPTARARERSRPDAERLKAGFGRSAAALAVMALLLWQGQTVGHSRVTVYNGLGRAVEVTAGGRSLSLEPFSHGFLSLPPNKVYRITTSANGRLVESFEQRLAPVPAAEVYNVAGAAPLMEWRIPRTPEQPDRFLGRPRWLLTGAEILFRTPSPSDEALVLSGYGDVSPAEMLASFESEAARNQLIELHSRWDEPYSPWFLDWQALLSGQPEGLSIFLERLRDNYFLESIAEAAL